MKFSEMIYKRLDIEEVKRQAEESTAALKAAGCYEAAKEAFVGWQTLISGVSTMMSIANIRHTVDTADEFYDKEKDFYDENSPLIQQLQQVFADAMLESPFRKEFESEIGPLYFKNTEIEKRTFQPELIPDLQEENKVSSEYVRLTASAQIEFGGGKRTLSEMSPYMQSADREERLAAFHATGEFFRRNQETLDRIYNDLVTIRTRTAQKLGHNTFIPLGYDRMNRNCYTEADVQKFREAVVKHIVPVAEQLKREQADRLGVPYPMIYPDDALSFPSGNARPSGGPQQILSHGQRMYRELSPETAEFIDFMMVNELFDVLSRKGKAGGGYCTSLPDYKSPFIFANFNGTAGDVEVITHEAGHAFAAYMARDILPLENRQPTLESCEIHSMSMEFFAWPWCEGFFGKDMHKFYYQHLAGALTFLPYGAMVDHFQHEMYRDPGMTEARRLEIWGGLEKIYRPWISDHETAFYKENRVWQRQLHIYQAPFYYIDYCLAQTVALQFWAAIRKDRKDAWQRYLKLVSKAGTQTFDGLVETAGMLSPFGDAALKEVSGAAVTWLKEFDRSALR